MDLHDSEERCKSSETDFSCKAGPNLMKRVLSLSLLLLAFAGISGRELLAIVALRFTSHPLRFNTCAPVAQLHRASAS
jgi:hypothetical protein